MTCQSYHCHQGRQPCPTPFTCRLGRDCTTLNTGNSDHSNPHAGHPVRKRSRTDDISLFFLSWACVLAVLVVLGMLAAYLSVKLA